MKRLTIAALISVVAATLAAVPGLASGTGPGYLQVSSFAAALQNDEQAKLSVTTAGAIPRRADAFVLANPVVGLAWADLGSGRVFVVTIHPVLGRDSHQNPDAWHAHTAILTDGASAPNDFCIVSIDSAPTVGIAIHGTTMTVNVGLDALPVDPSDFDAAVGFTIQPDSACTSDLAVRIVS